MNGQGRTATRRQLVCGGGMLITAMAAGCDFLSSEPETDSGAGEKPNRNAREAPSLAARVKAGELPPLAERLPKDPVAIQPVEEVGTYGGTWRTVILGPADTAWLTQLLLEPLVRWNDTATEIVPNVAAEFSAENGGLEYTIRIRQGIKWSDGEPFTADDIVFAQNDVANHPELTPVQVNNPTAEKIDDYTVRFVFEKPNSLFLTVGLGSMFTQRPAHYLKQFHKDYAPDADAAAKKEGRADWLELFWGKADLWANPELPRLHAWLPRAGLGEGQRVVFERNPYYWKVDTRGSQLPYIDEIAFEIISDMETMLLKALEGGLDMHFRHFNVPKNKPVLARERQRGDYRFFDTEPAIMNVMMVVLNLTHPDPVKREIFQNREFRIGLSHALNREEMVATVHQRQGEPWQAAPRPESEFYDEEFAKQYTEYDPDLANEYLDRAGFTERDGDGIRLGPDGKPIRFSINFASGSRERPEDALDLVRQYWRAVGVDARPNGIDRSLLAERNDANEDDAFAWEGDGGMTPIAVPDWYFPDPAYLTFGRAWSDWYGSAGKEGEEPPPPILRQMELYDQIKATPDPEEQKELMRQILQIAKEEFWVIGTVLAPPSYGIARNNFRNVPEIILDPGQIHHQIDVCQCFFKQ